MLSATAASAPHRFERNPPLFGLAITGEESLKIASDFGPGWIWRLEPGQWSGGISAPKMDPDGDGMDLNLRAAFELAQSAATNGIEAVPVLDSGDLLYLGKSQLGQVPPPPRACFLAELAECYAIPREMADAKGKSRAQTWHYRISADDWTSDANLRQFLADSSALKTGNLQTRVILEAGTLETDSPDECLARIAALKKSPAASAFDGLSMEVVLDTPDLDKARSALLRLQTTLGLKPFWVHSLRVGPGFAESLRERKDCSGISIGQAQAAYLSAAAIYARSLSAGGSMIFDLGQNPGSPMKTPVKRLQRYIHNYHWTQFQFSDHVCVIAYSHSMNPTVYFVFWDWAADSDFVPGKSKSFNLKVPLDEYLAIPIVDDPPHWDAPKTLQGTKLGLPLRLGQTPLLVEPSWIDKLGLHDGPIAPEAPAK